MNFEQGQIVQSRAGHDEGSFFCVMDVDGDFLLLADGKTRKANCPKRKRRKHVTSVGKWKHPVIEKLRSGEPVLDSELRRALGAFRDDFSSDQGGNTLGKERYDRA